MAACRQPGNIRRHGGGQRGRNDPERRFPRSQAAKGAHGRTGADPHRLQGQAARRHAGWVLPRQGRQERIRVFQARGGIRASRLSVLRRAWIQDAVADHPARAQGAHRARQFAGGFRERRAGQSEDRHGSPNRGRCPRTSWRSSSARSRSSTRAGWARRERRCGSSSRRGWRRMPRTPPRWRRRSSAGWSGTSTSRTRTTSSTSSALPDVSRARWRTRGSSRSARGGSSPIPRARPTSTAGASPTSWRTRWPTCGSATS